MKEFTISADERLQRIFYQLTQKCYRPGSNAYRYYGRLGVIVCAAWRNKARIPGPNGRTITKGFLVFKTWAEGHGYQKNLYLSMKDKKKGYKPSNCIWVTRAMISKAPTMIKVNGVPRTLKDLAAEYKLPKSRIYARYHAGWKLDEVLGIKTHIIDAKTNKRRKPVTRLDNNKQFRSASDAAEFYGVTRAAVTFAANHGTCCNGSFWKFTADEFVKPVIT